MKLAILVPVLGRPQQITPLIESIETTTEVEHQIVFICSPGDDTADTCIRSEAETIVVPWQPGRADFAKKINHAYGLIEAEWYFQAATDLRFNQGWDTEAMFIADKRHVGVIGTSDLGNPDVKRGAHSTHTFFARSYIETYGGTFDQSGVVFSELYDHQWTDNEFVRTAMKRNQWAFSRKSVVEHLHPHWGKGQMDATYDKALRETKADRLLFAKRLRMLSGQRPMSRAAERRRAQLEARRLAQIEAQKRR